MNPHIELVKKWLADDKSVSLEELKANKETADAAYWRNEAIKHVKKYEELTK